MDLDRPYECLSLPPLKNDIFVGKFAQETLTLLPNKKCSLSLSFFQCSYSRNAYSSCKNDRTFARIKPYSNNTYSDLHKFCILYEVFSDRNKCFNKETVLVPCAYTAIDPDCKFAKDRVFTPTIIFAVYFTAFHSFDSIVKTSDYIFNYFISLK